MIKRKEVTLSDFILYASVSYIFFWIICPILFVYILNENLFWIHIVNLIFLFIFSFLIMVIYDVFEYEKQQRSLEVSKTHKIINIVLVSAFFFIRLFVRIIKGKQNNNSLFDLIIALVAVLAEEVLTKCIFLRYLKTKKIHWLLRNILIGLMFAFLHIGILVSKFPLASILGLVVGQLFIIGVYEIYPSVIISTLYHYALDIIVMI